MTPQQLAAQIMETVFKIIPGDGQLQHDARCYVALAVNAGQDARNAMRDVGVELH